MKKSIVLLSILALLAAVFAAVAAKPLKIGDVIGKIYYTDIKTYIDGKLIESVNIGGRTMISAEDLQYMGYLVEWNDTARTLNITSNTSHNISGKVIIPDGKVAPKGGLNVEIAAFINPNPDPSVISRGYGPEFGKEIRLVIPEGHSSIEYIISVPYKFEPRYITAILPGGESGEPEKLPDIKPYYVLRFRYSYYLGNHKVEHGDFMEGYLDMSTGDKTGVDYTFDNIDLK
ncbi:MAG TPA: hypothetical protein PKU88_02675 [Bacillota bacterium]|nr:hypothetical protein [Bacillota bacterium]HNT03967.1 hypothetical protein [Bacillota bacterium]HPA55081.1 hypothetical protein [Bacillota bacterium]HPX68221.1 hypothetical protein [Bacillota bacterium]HQA65925.1 hypothetical protein [Bacillota bacterium]